MKKTLLFLQIVSVVFFLIFSSCKKENNNDNNSNNNNNDPTPTQKELKFLDITNAKSLLIINSNSKKDGSGNMLFKITDEGFVVEVPCIDQNGDTVKNTFSPSGLCNLSDNFLTVTFDNFGTFLVRKYDGAVFKGNNLPISAPDPSWAIRPDLFIQQDSLGNIYYGYNQKVIKLTITDPNNLTVSTYSAPGDQVKIFAIDKGGNLAYSQNQYGGVTRFRHASGVFNNFSGDGFWTDINNDNIYCIGDFPYNARRIIPSPFGLENYGDSTLQLVPSTFLVKIKNKNKVIGAGNGGMVRELYNQQGIINVFSYSYFNVSEIKMLASSDNYYYVLGTNASLQSVLLKVDPNGHTYSNLVTTGAYDIYNVVVNSSDELQFYALRMSDGKRVLAEIDNSGNIIVLSVLDGSTITVLERIN